MLLATELRVINDFLQTRLHHLAIVVISKFFPKENKTKSEYLM
jgi:hypothetical protein